MKKILWWKKIRDLKIENHDLKLDRVCDGYCTVCSNHLDTTVVVFNPLTKEFQKINGVMCKLDCKCPDYKEVEK